MELFKTIKLNLALCFYYPNQTHIFSVERLLAVCVGFLPLGSIVLFAFFEANNVTDYVVPGFMFVTSFAILISFIDTTRQTPEIFSFIDKIEKIINKSKHCHRPFIILQNNQNS